MPLKEFFEGDKSGAKKRLSYLIKYPDVLKTIFEWSSRHGLEELSFEEKIYHCVNELTELPIDPISGLLREYRGPKKGYSVKGKERTFRIKKTLSDIASSGTQERGGGISQRILNDEDLLNELIMLYPQKDVPIRAKIKLYLQGKKDIPLCKACGKMTSFQPSGIIRATCSEKCRRSEEQRCRSSMMILGNRKVRVQGYEQFVIKELLMKYKSEDILVSDEIEPIPYDENKLYHPDIKIISENKIIEVKSSYTFKADLDKNMKKKQAALEAGLNFEFHIWDLKQIIK